MLLILGDVFITAKEIADVLRREGYVDDLLEHQWSVNDAAELAAMNRQNELSPVAGLVDRDALLDIIRGREAAISGIFTHFFPVSRELISLLPKLRYVATLRSGLQNVDTAAASDRGVVVVNNPGRNTEAVAQFSVGLMLATCRGIAHGHAALIHGEWPGFAFRDQQRSLSDATIGIVGFGQIGSRVASLLRPFRATMLAYDPCKAVEGEGVRQVECLDQLLDESDIVTVHARVMPGAPLLGLPQLERIGPEGILINTARAELVDEAALVQVLRDRRLGAAGLDVFSVEPLPADHPLRSVPNLTLTPHLAGRVRGVNVAAIRLLAGRVHEATESAVCRGQ